MKPHKILAVGAALALGMGLLILLVLASAPVEASRDPGSQGEVSIAGPMLPDMEADIVATNTLSVQPASTVVGVGTVFTTHIVISDAQDLGGLEYKLQFPPAIVQGQSVELGSFPGSSGRTIVELPPSGDPISNTLGTVSHGFFSFGTQPGADGSGIIASIAFIATASGTGSLDLFAAQAADTEGQVLTPTILLDGQVSVTQPGVAVCCDASLSGAPGTEVMHTVTVTNTGDYTDTFDLTYEGHAWPTTGPSTAGPLAPEEGTSFEVTVTVPGDASGDDADSATVTAASSWNAAVTASVELTTSAEEFRVYLPLTTLKY